MGKQSRRKRGVGRPKRPGPMRRMTVAGVDCLHCPGADLVAADEIADLVAVITVEGEPTPVVEPVGAPGDHMEFDRKLCATGIKRFARRVMESDWPMLPEGEVAPAHVLVTEMAPGIRRKTPILVVMDHEMN